MGKAQWGGVVAVVVIAVVVVLVTQGVFTGSGSRDQPGAPGGSPARSDSSQDTEVAGNGGPNRESPDTGDSETVDGGATGSPRHDSDTAAVPETDIAGGESADADEGSTGAEIVADADEPSGPEVATDVSTGALQAEAESFVRELTEPSGEPVPVESADAFVGAERALSSVASDGGTADPARSEIQAADEASTTGAELAGMEVEPGAQPAPAAPGGVGAAGSEVAAAEGADPLESGSAVTEPRDPPGTEASEAPSEETRQARVDLPLSEEAPLTIAKLLGAEEAIASDAVFYIHTVRPDDDRGIWGIVHDGITENFARGVAVHRGGTTETYRVDIPPGADQLDEDQSSSFLGRIIHEKSLKTYVYNFRTDRLGRNPDLIFPGQEIVIVSFTPGELIEIYKYFARGG